MGNFRELKVWKKAKDLAVDIYKMVDHYPSFQKDYRIKNQITAAAVSIASNIAEGEESGSNPQSIRYFNIAKGSCAELITQLIILQEINHIPSNVGKILVNRTEQISRMLFKLIQIRTKE